MSTTDPLTETAVDQLDRLIGVAANARTAFAEHTGLDPNLLAVARVIAAAADAADRLTLILPEVFP